MSSDKKTSLRSASASGTRDSMNKTASPKATVSVGKDLKGASGGTIRPEPTEIDSFREEMGKLFREADEKQSVRIKELDDKFTKFYENLKADITSVKDEQTKTNETLSSLYKKVEEMEKSFYGLQPREHENVYERVRELLVKDMSLDETKV